MNSRVQEIIKMSNLAICRVCLACNTKIHHIANTPYQEILEKLATELYTADDTPETVCWMCLSALHRGQWLVDTARAAHEILTQLSLSGTQLSEDALSMHSRNVFCKLTWTPVQTLSIGKEFIHSPNKVQIKEDPTENEEITDVTSKDEQINCTSSEDELTVKNEEIICEDHYNITIGENHDDKGLQINCTISEDDSLNIKNEEMFCSNTTISENDDIDEQMNYTLSEDESFTVKNEEIFCDNITISENDYIDEQIKSTLSVDEPVTVRNEEIFCDNITIGENEYIGEVSKNQKHTSNISDDIEYHQCTENRVLINNDNKTHSENRSKLKMSTEVIVKDGNGRDCVRHICTTCNKMYKQRCHLLRHWKTHCKTASQPSGQPPKDVICETCGKGFATNSTLKKHLLAHTDIRDFACAHCPIKFVQKTDLVRHMRVHTGEKPYKCDVCDKKYSQKAVLVRHTRTHTGETPYSCDRCSLKFNRYSSMVRHVKRRHFSSDKRHYKEQRRP